MWTLNEDWGLHSSLNLFVQYIHFSFASFFLFHIYFKTFTPVSFLPLVSFSFLSWFLLFPPFQPGVVMEAPWRLLPSAGSSLQPQWPHLVQHNAAGANGPWEPPHQSPPSPGHLHRQATPGGGGGGGGPLWGSPRRVAPAWTWVNRMWGVRVEYLVVCLSSTCLSPHLFSDLSFPPGEGRPQAEDVDGLVSL